MKLRIRLAAALLAAALLAGCSLPGAGTAPAASPAPTAAPTPPPTPEPTPTPAVTTNPLTGEETGEDYTNRRPVAVALRSGSHSMTCRIWLSQKSHSCPPGASRQVTSNLSAIS